MNTIDSAYMKTNFSWDNIRSCRYIQSHGKNLFAYIYKESLSELYGSNKLNKVKEKLKANKNSGFSNNQQIMSFVKDLYSDYDIYTIT
jgi:hypothetical protein